MSEQIQLPVWRVPSHIRYDAKDALEYGKYLYLDKTGLATLHHKQQMAQEFLQSSRLGVWVPKSGTVLGVSERIIATRYGLAYEWDRQPVVNAHLYCAILLCCFRTQQQLENACSRLQVVVVGVEPSIGPVHYAGERYYWIRYELFEKQFVVTTKGAR